MDFNEMSWQRGDLSFVFNGENQNSGELMMYVLQLCVGMSVSVLCVCTYIRTYVRTITESYHNIHTP